MEVLYVQLDAIQFRSLWSNLAAHRNLIRVRVEMDETQTWLKAASAAKKTLKNAARLFRQVSAGYADARDAAAAKNNVKESIDMRYLEVVAAHKSVCALHAGRRRTRRFRR